MRTILIATALVVASFSSSFAQMPERYNPGPAKASTAAPAPKAEKTQAPKRDYQAEAQQHFAAWKQSQVQCFSAIGMKEGVDFRFNPQDATDVQVAKRARLASSGFNQAKIDECIELIGK